MTDITAVEPEAKQPKTDENASNPKASAASAPSDATRTKPIARSRNGKKLTGAINSTAKRQTKASQVEVLLERKAGVTLEQMCEATGWLAHTCRAFMTGLRKNGRKISRETNSQGKSVYRMTRPGKAEERS